MSEYQRRQTNRDRVLALLQSREKVSTAELCEVGGIRGTGRVSDLRAMGLRIDAEHAGGGLWYYRLVPTPDKPTQLELL